jgi:hypothetical protein
VKEVLVGTSPNGLKWRTTGTDARGSGPEVMMEMWGADDRHYLFVMPPEVARQLSLGLYETSLAAEAKEEE